MKFTITKEDFLEGLQQVQHVVSSRATLPILSNVLIEADGNSLRLTTTDLDVGVTGSVKAKGKQSATFTPDLPKGGSYEVRMSHNSNVRRANGGPVTIRHADGETTIKVNEGAHAPIDKLFRRLGVFRFEKGRGGSVTIGTTGTDGKYVIVDSVQFLPVTVKR